MPDLFPWSQTKAMPGDLSAGKPLCLMTPLSRCSPCFVDHCPADLQHAAHRVYCELFVVEPDSQRATYETHCCLRLCEGGPVAARGGSTP